MKISDIGEFGLIRNIQRKFSGKTSSILVGIGDDAAAISHPASKVLLATTDMLLEGVHFDPLYTDFYSLGWKSAAVNMSDIAAMGGIPRFCLTSLGLPSSIRVEQVTDFYKGFGDVSRRHGMSLVGGDTCGSKKGIVVSVTVLGEVEKKMMITRSGARPGDRIFVTGTLGDSAAGLELLKSGAGITRAKGAAMRPGVMSLIQKHMRPAPRVNEGRRIALSGCASAMIDISDGLSSDIWHICEQSGAGAEIHSDKIPVSMTLKSNAIFMKMPVLSYALSGGEDYELLFTATESGLRRLSRLKISCSEIGRITKGKGVFIVDERGRRKKLRPEGYDHFSS